MGDDALTRKTETAASFNSRAWRSAGRNLLHGPLNARRAAATARSISSLSPSATLMADWRAPSDSVITARRVRSAES